MQDASVRGGRVLLLAAVVLMTAALLMLGSRDAAGTHTCEPSLRDNDGDGLPLSCDPSDFWPDIDGDGFEDSLEVFVGTDPGSLCSYPLDIDNDGDVDIGDVLQMGMGLPFHIDDPGYRARHDLNANEKVDIGDVIQYRGFIFTYCPFPTHWSTAIAELRSGTAHLELAQVWYSNVGSVYVEKDAGGLPTCDEVKRAADHWSNTTEFRFSVGLTEGCLTTSDVRVFLSWVGRDPEFVAETVPWTASPLRPCTEDDPCHFADFAEIFLNKNSDDPALTDNADFRHVVLTHELGHVVGQGHTGGFGSCGPVVPYTIMFVPGFCWEFWGLHWVRPNDVLFTNVKY